MLRSSIANARSAQGWISVSLVLLAVWSAWEISGLIASESNIAIAFVGLGVIMCVIGVSILNNWRSGFYIFVTWLLFEDLIRKFMGNNMAIYFAKDALALLTYLSFFAAVRRKKDIIYRFPFMIFLSLFFWLGLLQCFNPESPSFLYSVLGFKLYFFYIPLAFIGYALVRTDRDLRAFLAAIIGLAGLIAMLGILQSIIGPSFLNPRILAPDIRDLSLLYRYSPESHQSLYQPNSVFVSAGRFDAYLLVSWILGLGIAAFLLLRRFRGRTAIFASVGVIAVALLMCGGRGVLVYAIASTIVLAVAFLWGAPWRLGQTHKLVKAIGRTLVVGVVSISIVASLYPNEVGVRLAYYAETMLPNSSAQQVTNRLQDYPIQEFEKSFEQGGWVMGHGIGTASLGVQYVSRWLGQKPLAIGVESGFGNLVLEYGILGLFLWWLWTAVLLISIWRIVRRLRQTAYFPLAFSIFWFVFLLLYPMTYGTLNFYEDYVYNAYLWLLVGVVFRLPALVDQNARPSISGVIS
jgi:hypothetical protein